MNSDDYLAIPGQVTIPAGQTTQSIDFFPVDDLLIEGDEELVLTLTGANSGSHPDVTVDPNNDSASITMIDNDKAIISVSTTDASENGPTNGLVTVSVDTALNSPTTVTLQVLDVTATGGVDYQSFSDPMTLVIPANALSASIPLVVIPDILFEEDETVEFTVVSTDNPLTTISTTQQSALLTIEDDDLTQRPTIMFGLTQGLAGLVIVDNQHATLSVDEDFVPNVVADQIVYVVSDLQTANPSTANLPVTFTATHVSGDNDLFPGNPPVNLSGSGSSRSFTHRASTR